MFTTMLIAGAVLVGGTVFGFIRAERKRDRDEASRQATMRRNGWVE